MKKGFFCGGGDDRDGAQLYYRWLLLYTYKRKTSNYRLWGVSFQHKFVLSILLLLGLWWWRVKWIWICEEDVLLDRRYMHQGIYVYWKNLIIFPHPSMKLVLVIGNFYGYKRNCFSLFDTWPIGKYWLEMKLFHFGELKTVACFEGVGFILIVVLFVCLKTWALNL